MTDTDGVEAGTGWFGQLSAYDRRAAAIAVTKELTVVDAPGTYGVRAADPNEPWGSATSVRSASAADSAPSRRGHAHSRPPGTPADSRALGESSDAERGYWSRTSVSRDASTRSRSGSKSDPSRTDAAAARAASRSTSDDAAATTTAQPRYGIPSWAALLVMLAGVGVGVGVDVSAGGTTIRGGLNIAIIVASVVAILIVRKAGMFPVVIAPPIVYSLGAAVVLYIRSGGLHDSRARFDVAANWLVYGFPAMAGATAAVLIIAGIRMVIRR